MSTPRSTAAIAGHPNHAKLAPVDFVCFVLTLISDIAYWKTSAMQWTNMSAWLLTIGLIVAVFAVIAGLIDFLAEPRIRAIRTAWWHGVLNAVALTLAILNCFVHTRDAYTSVVPTGLTLSVLVVLIMAVTAWLGWGLVHRHGVAVAPEDRP